MCCLPATFWLIVKGSVVYLSFKNSMFVLLVKLLDILFSDDLTQFEVQVDLHTLFIRKYLYTENHFSKMFITGIKI